VGSIQLGYGMLTKPAQSKCNLEVLWQHTVNLTGDLASMLCSPTAGPPQNAEPHTNVQVSV